MFTADEQMMLDRGSPPAKSGHFYVPKDDGYSSDLHHFQIHEQLHDQPEESPMMVVYMENEKDYKDTVPPENVAIYAYKNSPISTPQHEESASLVYNSPLTTNGSAITKVSLFLGSFCLFMFNPFVLSPGTSDVGNSQGSGADGKR